MDEALGQGPAARRHGAGKKLSCCCVTNEWRNKCHVDELSGQSPAARRHGAGKKLLCHERERVEEAPCRRAEWTAAFLNFIKIPRIRAKCSCSKEGSSQFPFRFRSPGQGCVFPPLVGSEFPSVSSSHRRCRPACASPRGLRAGLGPFVSHCHFIGRKPLDSARKEERVMFMVVCGEDCWKS